MWKSTWLFNRLCGVSGGWLQGVEGFVSHSFGLLCGWAWTFHHKCLKRMWQQIVVTGQKERKSNSVSARQQARATHVELTEKKQQQQQQLRKSIQTGTSRQTHRGTRCVCVCVLCCALCVRLVCERVVFAERKLNLFFSQQWTQQCGPARNWGHPVWAD